MLHKADACFCLHFIKYDTLFSEVNSHRTAERCGLPSARQTVKSPTQFDHTQFIFKPTEESSTTEKHEEEARRQWIQCASHQYQTQSQLQQDRTLLPRPLPLHLYPNHMHRKHSSFMAPSRNQSSLRTSRRSKDRRQPSQPSCKRLILFYVHLRI